MAYISAWKCFYMIFFAPYNVSNTNLKIYIIERSRRIHFVNIFCIEPCWNQHNSPFLECVVHLKFEEMIKGKMQKMTKLKDGPMCLENFETKSYISEMNLTDARTLFRVRSQTTDVMMNQRSSKAHARSLWKCSECGNIDTQSHILWCPFHAHLREGKSLDSDSDLVEYMKKVFIIREGLRTKDL